MTGLIDEIVLDGHLVSIGISTGTSCGATRLVVHVRAEGDNCEERKDTGVVQDKRVTAPILSYSCMAITRLLHIMSIAYVTPSARFAHKRGWTALPPNREPRRNYCLIVDTPCAHSRFRPSAQSQSLSGTRSDERAVPPGLAGCITEARWMHCKADRKSW